MGYAVYTSTAISGSLGVFGLHNGRGVRLLALIGGVELPNAGDETLADPGSNMSIGIRGNTDLIQGLGYHATPIQSGGTTYTPVIFFPSRPIVIQDLQLAGTVLTAASWQVIYEG